VLRLLFCHENDARWSALPPVVLLARRKVARDESWIEDSSVSARSQLCLRNGRPEAVGQDEESRVAGPERKSLLAI